MKSVFRKRIILIAVVLVVVAGVLLFAARNRRPATSEYFTAPVAEGPLRNVVNATGVVQTVVTVQVGSQVSGQIQDLYADYNSLVTRGQLLAKLDAR